MSPRTGRPTDDPKCKRLEIRLSQTEESLLDKESKESGIPKTKLLMEGFALSQLIQGEELKERLLKEYDNIQKLNVLMQEEILKLQHKGHGGMSDNERKATIQHFEEQIRKNDWLCKVIKGQLKRDFEVEI